MSKWAREWIRAYSPKVASFLCHSRRTTIWVMCLKYHKILCNSAKTVFLPAYHGFECWYASIHDPLTHSQMMLPTTTDFENESVDHECLHTNIQIHGTPAKRPSLLNCREFCGISGTLPKLSSCDCDTGSWRPWENMHESTRGPILTFRPG